MSNADLETTATLPQMLSVRMERLIESGTWRIGERIPSIRECRAHFGVSANTVVEAYQLLQMRGLVESRPRSGFYVCPPRNRDAGTAGAAARPQEGVSHAVPLKPSQVAPMRMLGLIDEARGRRDMVELGTALPSVDFLPGPALQRAMNRALRRASRSALELGTVQGHVPLRREVARGLLDYGVEAGPDELFITVGATEALHLALSALVRPGDIVAMESPTYFGFLQLADAHDLKVLPIPASAAGVDVDALESAILSGTRPSAIVVCPCVNNPLGAITSAAALRRLSALCARHGIAIIEDLTYSSLAFEQEKRRSIPRVSPEQIIVRCGSLSKAIAPGYRLGWCHPGSLHDRFYALKSVSTMATPMPSQLAFFEFMQTGEHLTHSRRIVASFNERITTLRQRVLKLFPDGTRTSDPEGGHVLWVELPKSTADTTALFDACVADGVSFTPGCLFTASQQANHALRLNAALPWNEQQERGLQIIADHAHRMRVN